MHIENFIENLGDDKEELLKKAVLCKSAEGLLALAKKNGVALDEVAAVELFALMQLKTG